MGKFEPLLNFTKNKLLTAGAVAVSWTDIEENLSNIKFNVYQNWIDNGFSAEMSYLKRGSQNRMDPRFLLKGAESCLVSLFPYSTAPISTQPPYFARYTRGDDYHLKIKKIYSDVFLDAKNTYPDLYFESKICVDTSAVLERSWAALAGLGWIGKNGMLIHPKFGSYHFIGVALLNFKTDFKPNLQKELCGYCDRCIQACPTGAILDNKTIDSKKCISYQTLETKLEINNPVNSNGWVAGCDVCQEVCPFNFKISKGHTPESNDHKWVSFLLETEEEYKLRTRNTALDRIKYQDFKRNLLLALIHSNEVVEKSVLIKLKDLISTERMDILSTLEKLVSS